MFGVCWLLSVVCYVLFVVFRCSVRCLLCLFPFALSCVVCCWLIGVCCLLLCVEYWSMVVVRCLLRVDCGMFSLAL